jgi:hypothetical protein
MDNVYLPGGPLALPIHQILISAACNRQVLTYPILGEMIGVPAQGLAYHLGHIMHYCHRAGLPPLMVLVIQMKAGNLKLGLCTQAESYSRCYLWSRYSANSC